MQLSFVGQDDHNEDNVMEVTVPGKTILRNMAGKWQEDMWKTRDAGLRQTWWNLGFSENKIWPYLE